MKALLQRVTQGSVSVDGTLVSKISKGIVCLLGISDTDTKNEADWLVNKVANVRLWNDPTTGKSWAASVLALNAEVLVVSQFTLYGSLKGNKPDFHRAMKGEDANELYEYFVQELKGKLHESKVQCGVFGAMMQVELVNDGPVTLEISSDGVNVPVKKSRRGVQSATKGKEQQGISVQQEQEASALQTQSTAGAHIAVEALVPAIDGTSIEFATASEQASTGGASSKQ